MMEAKKYQVALSFAGEQRDYVERVAKALQARGVSIFYDGFEQACLWGKNGIEFLSAVYERQSSYVMMFVSREYVEKPWPRHEMRSALSKAIEIAEEYVLPIRFDATVVPGLPTSVQYLQAENYAPEALAAMFFEKIGLGSLTGKASDLPPPKMTSLLGEVSFDYSSFNGRYILGRGPLEFETHFGRASDRSIYVYNHGNSIYGVALARGMSDITDVSSAKEFDYTSTHQMASTGQVVLWRNKNDFYCAMKLLHIADATRRDDRDEVRFRYAIQPDATANFSEFSSLTHG